MIHLHVHSEYSMLDGLSQMTALVERAKSIGASALALTDHGICSGIPEFIRTCEAAGIKPIPGCEAYVAKDRLKKGEFLKEQREQLCETYEIKEKTLKQFIHLIERQPERFELEALSLLQSKEELHAFQESIYEYLAYDHYHLVLLAMNNQGLQDLYAIISDANLKGFYNDPRTDFDFIETNNLGKHLMATSACLGSWFARLALAGRLEQAKQWIKDCKRIFGYFVLEKQATAIPAQQKLNAIIDQLAKETNTPVIVTTDVHYACKEDHRLHDILVSMSTGKCISDELRMKYDHEFWMKSKEEIQLYCNDKEAILETERIAQMVHVSMPKEPLFPVFKLEHEDHVSYFRRQCEQGLFSYALKMPIDLQVYIAQLTYEMNVIEELGFVDYFLIVADYIGWAKQNGYLVAPGRGSAAGSLVSFCMGITSLDPIKWNLLFERFLNKDRIEYPDIDSDFSFAGARAVQNYLKEKYGEACVSQIGTIGTLAAKSAIRMVGKTLGYTLTEQDQFAKAIPNRPNITLKEALLEAQADLQPFVERHPKWWEAANALEGHVRSVGVHAGGIVISPMALTKTVPLRLDKEQLVTTQFDMSEIKKLLIKFDILKLDTLDLIEQTMRFAGLWGHMDINDVPLNDQLVYKTVYQSLQLSGIFQVESGGMRKTIEELRPNCIEDIAVILALFRPGPMDLIPSYIARKFKREPVIYLFDELKTILESTYGIFVYQEQVMSASMVLGGLTRGQSDILRKAVSSKNAELANEWIDYMIYGHEALGIPGAIAKGYDLKKLLELKDQWIKFANYAFNFAHAAAYSLLSYQTAWLKTYHPVSFMAALLSISEDKKKDDVNKTIGYMKDCEQMGIAILPPDINESMDTWRPVCINGSSTHNAIRLGLGGIAGISNETMDEIMKHRPYESLQDVIQKVFARKVNKTKITALICAGAFDFENQNRNELLKNYINFKGENADHISTVTTKKDIMEYEKKYLGIHLTVRSAWDGMPDGKTNIQMTGIIIKDERLISKKGHPYGKLIMEHQGDQRTLLLFDTALKALYLSDLTGKKLRVKGDKSKNQLLVHQAILLTEGGSSE